METQPQVLSMGTSLSLHTSAEHNDIGLHLLQFLIAQSHPFHYSSGEVFDYNIRPRDEFFS